MHAVIRFLARSLLAAIFINAGIDTVRHPAGRAKKAAEQLPGLPEPELMARAQGVAMAAAGSALALGIKPGAAAGVLFLTLIPATYVGHQFWAEQDEAARRGQLTHFMKNLAIFGGLLAIVAEEMSQRRED